MNKFKTLCVATSSRADFGLLEGVMDLIEKDPELNLQVLCTGMHLSKNFGHTYKEIEKKFMIDKKVENLIDSGSRVGNAKSLGLGIISYTETLEELKPDGLILLGDRFEILGVAMAASILKIPIFHLHGGEITEGAFDNSFRHCITKLSHYHFTSHEQYKRRVTQLGENPSNVYEVGGFGVDIINKIQLLSKSELEESLNFKFGEKNLLITYHPVTLDDNSETDYFNNLLKALEELEKTHFIFTLPNCDANNHEIIKLIDGHVKRNPHRSMSIPSLGQVRYFSALNIVDGVVGNSSS